MLKARQVYQAVIRPAIAYRAAVWHQPATKPKGLAIKLQKEQTSSLRTVLGAFKATPVRQLETEAYVPPLDIWLNGRVASYQARLESTGIARVTQAACAVIQNRIQNQAQIRRRRRRRSRRQTDRLQDATPGCKRKKWAEQWIDGPLQAWDYRERPLVERDWLMRWKTTEQPVRPEIDPGGRIAVRTNTAPTKRILSLHKELQKAESALLVQCRTGRIGLARFLYGQRVPGVLTAQCHCGAGTETPRHIALFCTKEANRRNELTDSKGRTLTYPQLVGSTTAVRGFVQWMMFTNRLGQFSLAKRLLFHSE